MMPLNRRSVQTSLFRSFHLILCGPLLISKDLPPVEKASMIDLLHKYKDVFAWSHEFMKRLDPKFYQHQINLVMVANPYNKGVTA